ncbi:patatin-like phospholipase family protein [Piscirickettsia litoralis]|uniref:patatin-like phospholipase family protein n=1 Tax=Piscirickettsia litoralis TaxID=1891921 RepID=UPI001F303A74|nr:patatin-like phospholipase family protein [Piscirickettsia litoralis]
MATAQVNYFDEVVYLFQGGGAMGAFQVGVYEALMEEMYSPDWIVGISIGSINASIIAGNPQMKVSRN